MKTFLKYACGLALAGLFSITFISTANAQRGFHSGGVHASVGFGRGMGFRGGVGIGFRGGLFDGATTATLA